MLPFWLSFNDSYIYNSWFVHVILIWQMFWMLLRAAFVCVSVCIHVQVWFGCPYLCVSEAFCHCSCYRECWSWCIHFLFMSYLFKKCSLFMLFPFEQSTTCRSLVLVIVRTLSIQLKFIRTGISALADSRELDQAMPNQILCARFLSLI